MTDHHLSSIFYVTFFFYIISYVFCDQEDLSTNSKFEAEQKLSKLELFKTIFLETRVNQKNAIQTVRRNLDYEKQYKLINKAIEKIIEVITTSKAIVENSDYIPGSELPSNGTVTNALGQIVDNTAMFGDFQLKLPEITDRIMKGHPDWLSLIKWAIGFSNSTGIFDPKTVQMIEVLCQEMDLIEKKENFNNPYRKQDVKVPKDTPSPQPKQKKKVKKEKGPRMTKPRRTEL